MMQDKRKLAGIVAIGAAAALVLAMVLLHGNHAAAPPAPAPEAQTPAPEAVAPAVEKKHAATGGDAKPAADQPSDNADTEAPRSEPAAIAPLRKLFEESKQATPAAGTGEAPPVGRHPQPLGPAPTVGEAGESGVLQWSGSAPPSGGQVVIFDGTRLGGTLSGDALPGVPVNMSVDSPDIRIVEAPGPGNGNHRVILQVPANWNKPIRINWQVQKGVRP